MTTFSCMHARPPAKRPPCSTGTLNTAGSLSTATVYILIFLLQFPRSFSQWIGSRMWRTWICRWSGPRMRSTTHLPRFLLAPLAGRRTSVTTVEKKPTPASFTATSMEDPIESSPAHTWSSVISHGLVATLAAAYRRSSVFTSRMSMMVRGPFFWSMRLTDKAFVRCAAHRTSCAVASRSLAVRVATWGGLGRIQRPVSTPWHLPDHAERRILTSGFVYARPIHRKSRRRNPLRGPG